MPGCEQREREREREKEEEDAEVEVDKKKGGKTCRGKEKKKTDNMKTESGSPWPSKRSIGPARRLLAVWCRHLGV